MKVFRWVMDINCVEHEVFALEQPPPWEPLPTTCWRVIAVAPPGFRVGPPQRCAECVERKARNMQELRRTVGQMASEMEEGPQVAHQVNELMDELPARGRPIHSPIR